MTKIINAYYTNDIQDNIDVTYYSEVDGTYIMGIEPGSNEAIELEAAGWDKEALVNATGEYKREERKKIVKVAQAAAANEYKAEIDVQQRELKRARRQIVEAEALIKTWHIRVVESEALYKSNLVGLKNQRAQSVEADALIKEKEKQLSETTDKIEAFLKATISIEDKDAGFDKIIAFLKGVDKKDAFKRLRAAKVI